MKKNLGYGLVFLLVIAAGCFFFYIFYQESYVKFDQSKITISVDREYWTAEPVTVSVNYLDADVKVRSYSFDGGKTWQSSNEYTLEESKTLEVVLRSTKGKKSEVIKYYVGNIDKEDPKITSEDMVYVEAGKTIDFNKLYKAVDRLSGLKGDVKITTHDLDTSQLGTYVIEVYALDRALNSSSKKITIAVVGSEDPNLPKNKKNQVVSVTGLSVSHTKISLVRGTETIVSPIIKPSNATNQNVTWKSNNERVAVVDKSGKIKAVSAGTATVTASTVDGNKSSDIRVTVTDKKVEVTGITFDRIHDTVTTEQKTIVLVATVLPENATDQAIVWSSNKPNIASVKDGVVTIKGEGEAMITATTSNGKVATYKVTVRDNYVFQERELKNKEGNVIGYAIRVFKNGTEITSQVTGIVDPFTIKTEGTRSKEIEISIENHKKIGNSITIRTHQNYVTYRSST